MDPAIQVLNRSARENTYVPTDYCTVHCVYYIFLTLLRILVLRSELDSAPRSSSASPFKQFCSQTTLHGWQYLVNPRLPTFRRVLWTVTIFSSLVVAMYFIQWFVHGFMDDKVSTTIATTTAPLAEVHFPAVTICNNNQASILIEVVSRRLTMKV